MKRRLLILIFCFLCVGCSESTAQEAIKLDAVAAKRVCFSKDGKWLAAGGGTLPRSQKSEDILDAATNGTDGVVSVWDVKKDVSVFGIVDKEKAIEAIALSPESSLLAIAYGPRRVMDSSELFTLTLWDIKQKKQLRSLGSASHFDALSFSPKGDLLASASEVSKNGKTTYKLTLWSSDSGKAKKSWEFKSSDGGAVSSVAFSPDGAALAFGNRAGVLTVIDLANDKETRFPGHKNRITAVTFSSDGFWLATASIDTTVRLYDWRKGVPVSSVEAGNCYAYSAVFGHDSKTLFTGGLHREPEGVAQGALKAWSLPECKLIYEEISDTLPTNCLAVSGDGASLACGSVRFGVTVRSLPLKKK